MDISVYNKEKDSLINLYILSVDADVLYGLPVAHHIFITDHVSNPLVASGHGTRKE